MVLSDTVKSWLTLLMLVIVLLVLILAAEGVVRVRHYVKYGAYTNILDTYNDEATGLKLLKPGSGTKTIQINSLGFRGPEIEIHKPEKRMRLAFLGASTTFCSEVSANDKVWSHLVTEDLKQIYPGINVDYVNGGVPGYSTKSSLINLEKRINQLNPDVVVIYHATNDLSVETRRLAESQGIGMTNLAWESSALSKYSLLWHLVEKNLALKMVQNQGNQSAAILDFNPTNLGKEFRTELIQLVERARSNGAQLVSLVTFSIHLRPEQTQEQKKTATSSALYYMPYMSADNLITAFSQYNQIIREVAISTGSLLIEAEESIPGNPRYFHDSVHFTDEGSRRQADRVIQALRHSPVFRELVSIYIEG